MHLAIGEVEQRPELLRLVLQRRTRQQHAVLARERAQLLEQARLVVLEPVRLVHDERAPVDLRRAARSGGDAAPTAANPTQRLAARARQTRVTSAQNSFGTSPKETDVPRSEEWGPFSDDASDDTTRVSRAHPSPKRRQPKTKTAPTTPRRSASRDDRERASVWRRPTLATTPTSAHLGERLHVLDEHLERRHEDVELDGARTRSRAALGRRVRGRRRGARAAALALDHGAAAAAEARAGGGGRAAGAPRELVRLDPRARVRAAVVDDDVELGRPRRELVGPLRDETSEPSVMSAAVTLCFEL